MDGLILYCRLGIIFKKIGDQIGCTRHQAADAPRYALIGVTVNAARGFFGVEARQVNGLVCRKGTLIECGFAFGVTRNAETIVVFKLDAGDHGYCN